VALPRFAPLAFACRVVFGAETGSKTEGPAQSFAKPDPEIAVSSELEAGTFETKPSGTRPWPANDRLSWRVRACWRCSGLALNPQSIGEYLKLSIHAKTARVQADQILRQRGLDPNSYTTLRSSVDITDPVVNEFLRERIGIAEQTLFMTRAFQAPSGAVALFPATASRRSSR